MDAKGRLLAYICSPFSGDIESNTKRAREYCRRAVDLGYIPLAPHLLLPQFLSEEAERAIAIEMDYELLDRCDLLLVCGDRISSGMESEIRYATENGMEIMHLMEE